jgi:hypothetical protein
MKYAHIQSFIILFLLLHI